MKKRVLVIDVGGTSLKISLGSRGRLIQVPSGRTMTPAQMVARVRAAVAGRPYDVVSIGYPGPVKNGKPAQEPRNLGRGWLRFDFRKAFGRPVRMMNDAAMQALGNYTGGRLLFLGLGTGLGSALVADGVVVPLEIAHMPYRNSRTYEDYVGVRGYRQLGLTRWTAHVWRIIEILRVGLQVDTVVVGGGRAARLRNFPPGVRRSGNEMAALGGVRLWQARP